MNIFKVEYNSILCKANSKIKLENKPYYTAYIIKSVCRIILAGKEYKVFPDCLVIVNKGDTLNITGFECPVYADYFCYDEKFTGMPEYTEDLRCNELSSIIKTMKTEEIAERKYFKKVLWHYGYIFYLTAMRIISEKSSSQKIHPFYRLREDIYNQPYNKWNIEKLIADSGLSRRQFYHTYKAVFDTSIKQDIIASRMEYARYLLTHTDMRISQIAENCCYNSDQHFIQSFLKRYGVSPTKFRFNFIRFHAERKD